MKTATSKLEARVIGENYVNEQANKLFYILNEYFTPLVGCKVVKADGSLLKKIQDDMPEIDFPKCTVYKNSSNYVLSWSVKVCVNYEGRAYYSEATVYIGDLVGTKLSMLYPSEQQASRKTDYTVEEIEAAREEYKQLEKQLNDARSKLFPFGEYDR